MQPNPISIYIHWPFCLSLCPYCDFNSHIASHIDHDRWLKAFKTELSHFASVIKGKQVKSIFFGGGTPSLMQPFVVEGIINKIAELGSLSDSCEISLEANPTSFETNKFIEFKAAGVNRVSLGIQSLNDKDLSLLGRKHSSHEAVAAIKAASKIFPRYSFDLIYTRPDQTITAWQQELTEALKLADGHISLYQLTIEKGTPFFNLARSGKLQMPKEELSIDLYEWTDNYLQENNYHRYEISNYAVQGQECRHNLCYWNYEEYLGIGAGSHSRIHCLAGIFATMMYHKPEKWLTTVEEFGHGIQNNLKLSTQEIVDEFVMMKTRLSAGVTEQALKAFLNLSFDDIFNQDILNYYISNGLILLKITDEDKILQLSDQGLLLHNYIIPRLIKAIA